MSSSEIFLLVLAILVLFAVAGSIAQRRRLEGSRERFAAHLGSADGDLAAAHAEDRGWEPRALEDSARAALSEQRPEAQISDLALVQVIDLPGADEDRAVFRAHQSDGSELMLTMGRRDGDWVAERLEG